MLTGSCGCKLAIKFYIHMPNRLLWSESKVEKAREWFERTIKLDSDYGDAWACYYKFETIYGNEVVFVKNWCLIYKKKLLDYRLANHPQTQLESLKKKCVQSEPHHGQLWCSVSKDVNNWRLKTNELLPLVAKLVPVPTWSWCCGTVGCLCLWRFYVVN